MAIQHNRLPDCSLSALRFGQFPSGMRHPFMREAARACAHYVQGGGILQAINDETSHLRNGHLHLLPLPPGTSSLPSRSTLESGLLFLEDHWHPLALNEQDRLRFLLGFCDHLAKFDSVWLSWARLWLKQREQHLIEITRRRYQSRLKPQQEARPRNGAFGCWHGQVETDAEGLLQAVQQLSAAQSTLLKKGRRATVWQGTLLGEEVIVKYFAPNPRWWRQRLGQTRARQAWAGTHLLAGLNLKAPDILGYVECIQNHVPKESYVIHRRLANTQAFNVWLRKNFHSRDKNRRIILRHQLRNEILQLYRHGIYHKDTKAHNLLVRESADGIFTFWWIDLEDIRATGNVAFWKVVRNFYQLNGSVPRRISREERIAFVRGFRSRYPLAAHPLVIRFVEQKTRIRLQREVKRICTS